MCFTVPALPYEKIEKLFRVVVCSYKSYFSFVLNPVKCQEVVDGAAQPSKEIEKFFEYLFHRTVVYYCSNLGFSKG